MTEQKAFAVVLRDTDLCLYRHPDFQSAMAEAKRLAEKVPNSAFYVLAAVRVVGPVKPPVPVHGLDLPGIPDMDAEIPF